MGRQKDLTKNQTKSCRSIRGPVSHLTCGLKASAFESDIFSTREKGRDFFSPGNYPDITKSVSFPTLREKGGRYFAGWETGSGHDFQLDRVFLVIHKFIPEFSMKQSGVYSIWIKGLLRFTPKWQFGAHEKSLYHPFKTASLNHLCPLGGRSHIDPI